ncbi:MAG: tyrosine-type recombinase/integrase [Agriterribacter sp.]
MRDNQLEKGKVKDHPEAATINKVLKRDKNIIEAKIISFIDRHQKKGVGYLRDMIKGVSSGSFLDFVTSYTDKNNGSYSKETIKNYKSLANKVERFKPGIKTSDINFAFMRDFEASIRAENKGNNTIVKNIQTLKSLLNKAAALGHIDEGDWEKYRKPKYIQKVPTWLTEDELNKFAALVFALGDGERKQAGYYYLLCCYTGYRIGTAKKFDYITSVVDGKIFIRSTKNHRIVSIPVHTRLSNVLNYCKDNPFKLSEPKAREHVKKICEDAGIAKDLIFHSSRHTFAMLLMAKEFTVDEVAELIGDTPLVTKVYARIHNDILSKKIMEKLG